MPDVEYAFLADAAEVQPGQKFHVLGGGITRLTGPSLPFVHPHLSLVVGLRMTSVERNREHDLMFVLSGPDGAEVATASGKVVARGSRADTADVILTLAIDLWNLQLRAAGEHHVRVLIDGSERKRLELVVAQATENRPEQRYLA